MKAIARFWRVCGNSPIWGCAFGIGMCVIFTALGRSIDIRGVAVLGLVFAFIQGVCRSIVDFRAESPVLAFVGSFAGFSIAFGLGSGLSIIVLK